MNKAKYCQTVRMAALGWLLVVGTGCATTQQAEVSLDPNAQEDPNIIYRKAWQQAAAVRADMQAQEDSAEAEDAEPQSQRWLKAAALFEEVTKQRPKWRTARWNAATAFWQADQPKQAWQHFRRLVQHNPSDADALAAALACFSEFAQAKDQKEAQDAIWTSVAKIPAKEAAPELLALWQGDVLLAVGSSIDRGDVAKHRKLLTQILARTPSLGPARAQLAWLELGRGGQGAEIAALILSEAGGLATTLSGTKSRLWMWAEAAIAAKTSGLTQAIPLLDAAVKAYPKSGYPRLLLTDLDEEFGNSKAALKGGFDAEAALDLGVAPQFFCRLLSQRARLATVAGKGDLATQTLEASLEPCGRPVRLFLRLARAHLNLRQDPKAALMVLQRLKRVHGPHGADHSAKALERSAESALAARRAVARTAKNAQKIDNTEETLDD